MIEIARELKYTPDEMCSAVASLTSLFCDRRKVILKRYIRTNKLTLPESKFYASKAFQLNCKRVFTAVLYALSDDTDMLDILLNMPSGLNNERRISPVFKQRLISFVGSDEQLADVVARYARRRYDKQSMQDELIDIVLEMFQIVPPKVTYITEMSEHYILRAYMLIEKCRDAGMSDAAIRESSATIIDEHPWNMTLQEYVHRIRC